MNSFKFLLCMIVCLLLLIGSSTLDVLQQSYINKLEARLERYETGVTSITIPNIMTGETETYMVMGVSPTEEGFAIPILVSENQYYEVYTKIRMQYLNLIEEREKRQSELSQRL